MSYNGVMPYPADPEQIAQALSQVIFACRQAAGLSQEELAERSGVSQNAISDIERGKRGPAFITFLRLAHGLGISPAELVDAIGQRLAHRP